MRGDYKRKSQESQRNCLRWRAPVLWRNTWERKGADFPGREASAADISGAAIDAVAAVVETDVCEEDF